jgi:heme/copper-type cytochrome/quinol oxidase subunit 4
MTNATKNLDASRTEVINKLIDYNKTQNELIFATRKRLFNAEKNQTISFILIGILTLTTLLLAVNDTLIKGAI